jgi:hypothetical protein
MLQGYQQLSTAFHMQCTLVIVNFISKTLPILHKAAVDKKL